MRLKTNHWLALGAVTLSVLWLLSGVIFRGGENGDEAAEPPPMRVVVDTLDYRQTPGGSSISGRTEANYITVAQARTNGIVIGLPVREGETVRAGQTIARLSDEARGETVREAEARLEQARVAYEASAELAAEGFYPRLQLDQRRAEQAAAQAALDRARVEAARSTVAAPVSGVLDQLLVDPGEAVQTGAEIARIVDLDPIVAVAGISDAERATARAGDPAVVMLPGGRQAEGVVRFVAARADPATATYRLEVEIANPDGEILAGQIADIRLASAGGRAAQVVRSAVTLNENGVIGVKYVEAGNRVAFAPIQIVQDDPRTLWISGPPDGAMVIVRGQEYVREGAVVEPVRASPAAGDDAALVAGSGTGGAGAAGAAP